VTTTCEKVSARIDQLCIDTIRTLAIDAVERANSGHPGAPMGAAPMAYVVWDRHLKHDPSDPNWFDRDRFVLSAGHASMLLYALLYLTGYDLSLDDIKAFRSFGSRTPGHPERGVTPGVEVTTGPLGQGFATGVGMAIAERLLAERFNRAGLSVIDHHVYALVSDGDLMEGVSSEAASLAGHLRLGKLIYLYDSNRISIDGPTDLTFTEDVGLRFKAYGWHVQRLDDGNDIGAIDAAIHAARADPRPSLIIVNTEIAYGAPTKQGSAEAHGAPLGPDEVRGTKRNLGFPEDTHFYVPHEALNHMRAALERGAQARAAWEERVALLEAEDPAAGAELRRVIAGELPAGWDAELPTFDPADGKIATRSASGAALNALAARLPELVGGSADLAGSTSTELKGAGALSAQSTGRNVFYGVREHAMAAAVNGMTLHGGVRAFGGTFLTFSDYMRPAIRLAALMETPSIFVFTHDSIGLGEDGPTHQPVEHLMSLRAIPNLVVIRPADANETVEAWRALLPRRGHPCALCLSRQGLPVLRRPDGSPPPVERGAYAVHDPEGAQALVIATGSEVHVALAAAELLAVERVPVKVVSMPSWELFEQQPQSYQDQVLPPAITARVAVEAGATLGWCRWVGERGEVVGLDRFGASGPGDVVLEQLGITPEAVAEAVRRTLARSHGRG
jgi:transketolase